MYMEDKKYDGINNLAYTLWIFRGNRRCILAAAVGRRMSQFEKKNNYEIKSKQKTNTNV